MCLGDRSSDAFRGLLDRALVRGFQVFQFLFGISTPDDVQTQQTARYPLTLLVMKAGELRIGKGQ